MKHLMILLAAINLLANNVLAQRSEPIQSEGYFIIQDKVPFKKGDCIFCNTETMPDRIVLDSTKKMIAKKVSNPFGYVYYEWKRKDGLKTFEDIVIHSERFRDFTYYTDSGTVRPEPKNSFNHNGIKYFHGLSNPKMRYNGFNIAQIIWVKCTKQAVDSLIKLYNIPKHKILPDTKWCIEFNYYESGHLQSKGIIVKGLKEGNPQAQQSTMTDMPAPENRFKIGEWLYYDESGKQFYKEILTTLKSVR